MLRVSSLHVRRPTYFYHPICHLQLVRFFDPLLVVIFSLLIASATIPNGWKAVTHAGMTMTPAGFLAGVAFGITLITNLWATGIIGWRAWYESS